MSTPAAPSTAAAHPTDQVQPRPRDPAKALRGIGAAILGMEGVVVALAIPVLLKAVSDVPAVAVWGLAILLVLDFVLAGMVRKHERLVVILGTAVQVATIAEGVLSGMLLILAVLFAVMWGGWLLMRRAYYKALAAYLAKVAAQPQPPAG